MLIATYFHTHDCNTKTKVSISTDSTSLTFLSPVQIKRFRSFESSNQSLPISTLVLRRYLVRPNLQRENELKMRELLADGEGMKVQLQKVQ